MGPETSRADRASVAVSDFAARLEDEARRGQLEPTPRDRISLKPAAGITARFEPKPLELVRDILRRHLEPAARRVATQHRVIGDDPDAVSHIRRGDGAGGAS